MKTKKRRGAVILERYAYVKEDIEKAERAYKRIANLLDWVAGIPSPVPNMSGMPGSGKISQPTEQNALRRIQLGDKYDAELKRRSERIDSLVKFALLVEFALGLCSDTEEEIAIRHYLRRERMRDIAKDLALSEVSAYRIQRQAIERIEEVFVGEEIPK